MFRGVMSQDAGLNDEQLQMLRLSGLVHQGKLADTTKLSECDQSVFVIRNN